MDVLPSIESTNNVLIKLVEAFNKVDDSINQNLSNISDQIRSLPPVWPNYSKEEGQIGSELSPFLLMIVWILMTAVVTLFGLGVFWLFTTARLRKYTIYGRAEEKKDDFKFKKLDEEGVEKGTSEKNKPLKPSTRARKLTLFFSLDIWMFLLLVTIITLHINTFYKVEADWDSVQFCVDDGNLTMLETGKFMLTRLHEFNNEMIVADEKWLKAIADHTLSAAEIQYIKSSKVDVINAKFDRVIESGGILRDFIDEGLAKQKSLLLSFFFFITYTIVTHVGLTLISNLFPSKVDMFFVNIIGNSIMLFYIVTVYVFFVEGYLENIHPYSLLQIPIF